LKGGGFAKIIKLIKLMGWGSLVKYFLTAVLMALPLFAHSATVVMDFQQLEVENNINNVLGDTYTEDGFQVAKLQSNFSFGYYGTLAGSYSGSTALFDNLSYGEVELTQVGGGAFTLHSIDLAELGSSGATSVTFLSNKGHSQTFNLDENRYGAETFYFDSVFERVTSVIWIQEDPFHQFDNIVVTAVPIPAAVWLFGSALAGLGWMRRKQAA
jgi:hypothetical protein